MLAELGHLLMKVSAGVNAVEQLPLTQLVALREASAATGEGAQLAPG